ncbi:helix-turn-helix domain-containing protein [Gracilibacillus salitolerans]|uniref:Helix-turn-helix domain-containing protein n=1 Tax=Gracilibacillus salitolerans TaxID=2663022 RepID=A0A5Q2TS43_9BACI|nr:helix-turn-helix domain-containing protein [Gracilibacillus salitolerans]QGH35588.1 helix-turn-helix domain-containing protein [Gracilibacillus salitolerans]
MKNSKKKHYYKLVAFFILLSCLPVMLTGSLSYSQSSKAVVDFSNDEKKQNLYQIQTNVEQVLKYVDLSATYFINSSNAQQLLFEDISPDLYTDFRWLKSELVQLQNIEYGIEDIVFANLDNKWLINNEGFFQLDENTSNQINSHYLQKSGKTHWLIEEKDQIRLPNATIGNCSKYIYLVKELPLLSTRSTSIIAIFIPACELTKIMSKSNNNESFLILDEYNQVIAHSNAEYTEDISSVSSSLFSNIENNDAEGQLNLSIEDTTYKVTYDSSSYNNWTYISFVKISDLHKKSSSVGLLIIIIVCILLIVSIILSVIGSNFLYKPIKKINIAIFGSLDKSQQTVNQTSEFEFIETHIENLLDKNKKLKQRMQNQIIQLKQLFMIRLLHGRIDENEIQLKLQSYHYPQNWNWLTVFSIKIDVTEDNNFNENDQELILFAINNLINDIIPNKNRLTPIVLNNTQTTVIITESTSEPSYTRNINKNAELIQKKIKDLLHVSISIGISNRFKNLHEAENAFNESMEALKYRLKMGNSSVIYYKNLNHNYSNLAPYPIAIINKLFDFIKISDYKNANMEALLFFEYIERNEIKHQQLNIILSRFLFELFELKESLGVQFEDFDSIDMIRQHHSLKSFDELKNWILYNVIQSLIIKLDAKNESKNKKISYKIIRMIHENYNQNISLEFVSSRLHYNPNYLSNIFQKEIGYTFTEYLLEYRINKAKHWLTTTNMSVKSIATELQYKNSQNFIRSFRKMEGITPGKYRSNFERKEEGLL